MPRRQNWPERAAIVGGERVADALTLQTSAGNRTSHRPLARRIESERRAREPTRHLTGGRRE
jgi:hypothetical protein